MLKSLAPFIVSLLVVYVVDAAGSGSAGRGHPELYAYFEAPLSDDDLALGPSKWKDLDHIPGNQCGGNGQVNGFGQSPIVLS